MHSVVLCISITTEHEKRYKLNINFTTRVPPNIEATKEDYMCFTVPVFLQKPSVLGAQVDQTCEECMESSSPSQCSSYLWEPFSELMVQNVSCHLWDHEVRDTIGCSGCIRQLCGGSADQFL